MCQCHVGTVSDGTSVTSCPSNGPAGSAVTRGAPPAIAASGSQYGSVISCHPVERELASSEIAASAKEECDARDRRDVAPVSTTGLDDNAAARVRATVLRSEGVGLVEARVGV